ncbi:hypothetical protein SDRG_05344 [Saprolegnia diclina VS20]|uniref:EF-hand domain-containing protein n=1 Tax=Saprolegnia diclina (strain VS20) TaxID=1156394 RepID=T0S342_SAPDV|nr:hypothetical protein SDRG_05344 [Saprolegnia diclina VS20]EQC37117.1 hypothetical protein SDRG_05344 [Saprolegnia diclina VS20]|eukprot:XP_008609279.1 hypothetical protein SDRG_05344 [Saprolegnia diclina VS20]
MADDNLLRDALDEIGFETIFAVYSAGREAIATEHLSTVLAKMGYSVARRDLERYLDELDPDATGDITKSVFLQWFALHADRLGEDDDEPTTRDDEPEPLSAIHSEMLDAKMQRKRTEDDVQLLANRLAHLRMEEKKAQKKIDEANKRAREIELVKKRNADHLRMKREHMERQQSNVRSALVEHSKTAVLSQKRKETAILTLTEQRAKQAQDKKARQQQLSMQLAKEKEAERHRLLQQSEAIKRSELEAARKRELARKKHEQQLVRNARDKLADEYTKKSVAENILREMESEEARLIEKLRDTQEHQKEAFLNLEHAIQLTLHTTN